VPIRLPGGRGQLTGPDAQNVQNEQWRAQEAERSSSGLIFNFLGHPSSTVVGVGQNGGLPYYFAVGRPQHKFDLVAARILVTTLAAGSTFKTALYRLSDDRLSVRQLPFTEVTFSGAATGLITQTFAQPVTITPDMELAVGSLSSDSLLLCEGARTMSGRLLRGPTGSTSLVPNTPLGQLSAYSDVYGVISVVHLSVDATRFW